MLLVTPVQTFAGGKGVARFILSEATRVEGVDRSQEYDKRLEKIMLVGIVGTVTVRAIAKDVGESLHKRLKRMGVKDYKQIKKDVNTPIWEYESENPIGKPKPKNLRPDPTIRW